MPLIAVAETGTEMLDHWGCNVRNIQQNIAIAYPDSGKSFDGAKLPCKRTLGLDNAELRLGSHGLLNYRNTQRAQHRINTAGYRPGVVASEKQGDFPPSCGPG